MRCRENRKRGGAASVNKDMSCKLANGLRAVGLAAGPVALAAACMAAAPTMNVRAAQNTAEHSGQEQSAQNARDEAEKAKNAAEESYNQAVEAAKSAGVTAETAAAAEAEAKTAKDKEKEAADASSSAQTAAEEAAEAVSSAETAEQDALGKKESAGEDKATAEENVIAAQTAYDTAEQARKNAAAKADPASDEYLDAAEKVAIAQTILDKKDLDRSRVLGQQSSAENAYNVAKEEASEAYEAMNQAQKADEDAWKAYTGLIEDPEYKDIRDAYEDFTTSEENLLVQKEVAFNYSQEVQKVLEAFGTDSDQYKIANDTLSSLEENIYKLQGIYENKKLKYESVRLSNPEATAVFESARQATVDMYNKFVSARNAYNAAAKDAEEKEDVLNDRKKKTKAAIRSYDEAKNDLFAAKAALEELESDSEDAAKAAEEAEENLNKAKQTLKDAEEAYDKAAEAYGKESDALKAAKEELAAKKKAWEDAENAASEARKLAENKAQEAANQKSLYQAVMETHNALEAALEKLRIAIANYQETGNIYTLSYIRQTLDEIGDRYGITISEVVRRDVSGMSEEAAEKTLIEALSQAQYAQWYEFSTGERTIIPKAVVSGIIGISNDVYFDFIYMGYRWTVQLPSGDVLQTLLNADGTLDLLTFISETNKSYIVRIAAVQ